MNILSVSDRVAPELIGDNSPLPKGSIELIVGCGDLPPEYLSRLQQAYDVPLFYVLGNHDIRHEKGATGCEDITRRIVSYGRFSFLGFSGSRWYNGNRNQYHEREMRSQIRRLWFGLWRLKRLDVVITHAPPRFINDAEDPCHKGFRCYRGLIDAHRPSYFIHGHIHRSFDNPADRVHVVGRTQVINSYGYHIFTLKDEPDA